MAQFYSRVGNFAAIGWCSFGVALIGVIFMVAGAIITGIAYTEITPPNYDDNYHRYLGSSVPRLVGPFLLAFGTLLLLGSCGFFAVAFWNANAEYSRQGDKEDYEYTPGDNGKPAP